MQTLQGHAGSVHAVATIDDQHAISGSYDKTLKVWDVDRGVGCVFVWWVPAWDPQGRAKEATNDCLLEGRRCQGRVTETG